MDAIGQYWAKQSMSLNRESGDEFYRKKAKEHRDVLSDNDAQYGILDLGCGAGELLEQLAPLAKVAVGIDYSPAMLAAARRRLDGRFELELLEADVFTYLPNAEPPVWTTTAAINQYLDGAELERILDLFAANAKARTFYLFDCIDPMRYDLLVLGISYRPEHLAPDGFGSAIKRVIKRLLFSVSMSLNLYGRDVRYLGSPGMGYGQRPAFWLRQCAKRGLCVEIVSSRYYEYRYHVIIRKDVAIAAGES